jgi:hypothetical protein
MAETVYLIGAGINRSIRDLDGLQPPLATDLFQQALKCYRTGSEHYRERLKPLFDYIQTFWKLSVTQLENISFDLEACYTLIQLQASEAEEQRERDKLISLLTIEYLLTAFLMKYLSEIEHFVHHSESFQLFGERIYTEKPAVLTFNYDTLIETAIESASHVNTNMPTSFLEGKTSIDVPDEELSYSHHNWNRPLAYGIKFDEVQLHRAGLITTVSGERFYSHQDNRLYDPPLLKLHGSINWFVHTGIRRNLPLEKDQQTQKGESTALFKGDWDIYQGLNYDEIILPIIVTPVLIKDLNQPIIHEVWKQAYKELSTSKRLIVGGYSFPPTDFNTRRLFLEVFSQHALEELVVINPDTRVVQLVKDLCHFRKPVLTCHDLNEFVSL